MLINLKHNCFNIYLVVGNIYVRKSIFVIKKSPNRTFHSLF